MQIANEAVALFVRFWLTSTPPLPDATQSAAQASGRQRYKGFIEALGRRMEKGQSLARELSDDVRPADVPQTDDDLPSARSSATNHAAGVDDHG